MTGDRSQKKHDLTANLQMAFDQLTTALQSPITEARDLGGNIMAFVNVYELLWTALKEALDAEGIVAKTPRQCFEEAFRSGLIKEPELWVSVMKDRNSVVHTYNQDFAKELNARISSQYYPAIKTLVETLRAPRATRPR